MTTRNLERDLALRDGTTVHVRSIRPEDEAAIVDLFARMSPEDVRSRFFAALKALPPALLARLTHIDPEREVALVALVPGSSDALLGEARRDEGGAAPDGGVALQGALTPRAARQAPRAARLDEHRDAARQAQLAAMRVAAQQQVEPRRGRFAIGLGRVG